ncbi:hypothetical protein ACET8Q_17320 [Aeromonas veronii]
MSDIMLNTYFVAFIDILGFSEMVRYDSESPLGQKYLSRLFDVHQQAGEILGGDMDYKLIQFSDSIVLSAPFNIDRLPLFIKAIALWQRNLLLNGFLCRGGVTFGKHFINDNFLFSKALIDAYHMESNLAKHPRVIISDDLIQLSPTIINDKDFRATLEDDGLSFVDYIFADATVTKETLQSAIERIISESPKKVSSVQEKMRWLSKYTDFKLNTSISTPTFTELSVDV